MNSVSQLNQNDHTQIKNSVEKFLDEYDVRKLLHNCGADKARGIAILTLFAYLLSLVFNNKSMYMDCITGKLTGKFSKNSLYRFINNTKTNWERVTTILSARIINITLDKLTSESREDVFIVDDSMYNRTGYKKTELCSKVFDHTAMNYKKGYRMLTLGWSDGNSFMPIVHRLLATCKSSNMLGPVSDKFSPRSTAGRRRLQAQQKGTDVMVDLVKYAQRYGHKAKYILFDTWFCSPKCIYRLKKECHINTIAMAKKTSKVNYELNGQPKNLKQIFAETKKRRGRSKYLISVELDIVYKEGKEIHKLPGRIVCIRNRNNRKDWIAIITTDTSLSEEEIIRIYGKRWNIEVFFKTCKSMLKLLTECHSLSYDALTAHVSIVFIRYMFLSLEQRRNTDDRTIGELFYIMVEELADISFAYSMSIIMDALLATIQEQFKLTDEQIQNFVDSFTSKLPTYIKKALNLVNSAKAA